MNAAFTVQGIRSEFPKKLACNPVINVTSKTDSRDCPGNSSDNTTSPSNSESTIAASRTQEKSETSSDSSSTSDSDDSDSDHATNTNISPLCDQSSKVAAAPSESVITQESTGK